MQKKVMALAVAGALALPVVAAAQSSVQISGRVAWEYGNADAGSGRPSYDGTDNPGGSNIRFSGQESIGGGMSVWFQCESSTDVRGEDTTGFCTRNSAVGFKGGFGNVYAGRWDTPMKRALNMGTVGAEETGILGMSFIGFGGSGGSSVTGVTEGTNRQRWKRREVDMISYDSPNFSGFQLSGAFSSGRGATNVCDGVANEKPRVLSIGGTYVNGPLSIGLAYERHDQMGARVAGGQDNDDSAWGLGISYVIGPVTVGFNYLDAKYETGPGQETKKQYWVIGADWRLPGPHMLSIQYVKADDTEGNGASIGGSSNGAVTGCLSGTVVNCSSTGADAWSLGYTYRVSKRTSVRLGYVNISNDSRTNTNFIGSSQPPRLGDSVDGYAFLVKHDF